MPGAASTSVSTDLRETSDKLRESISRAAESLPPLDCFGRQRKTLASSRSANPTAIAPSRAKPTLSMRRTPAASMPGERAYLRGGARDQPTTAANIPVERAFLRGGGREQTAPAGTGVPVERA